MRSTLILVTATVFGAASLQAVVQPEIGRLTVEVRTTIERLKKQPFKSEQQTRDIFAKIQTMPGFSNLTAANKELAKKAFDKATSLVEDFIQTVETLTSRSFYEQAFRTPREAWLAIYPREATLRFKIKEVADRKNTLSKSIIAVKEDTKNVKSSLVNTLTKWLEIINKHFGSIKTLEQQLKDLERAQKAGAEISEPAAKPTIDKTIDSIRLIIANLRAQPLKPSQVTAALNRVQAMPGYQSLTADNKKLTEQAFAAASALIEEFIKTTIKIETQIYEEAFKNPRNAWLTLYAWEAELRYKLDKVEQFKNTLNKNISAWKSDTKDVKNAIINNMLNNWLKITKEYFAGNIQKLTPLLKKLEQRQKKQKLPQEHGAGPVVQQ